MSCCGSQRRAMHSAATTTGRSEVKPWTSGIVEFEYSGRGQLSVTGPSTGTVYRFAAQGARVRVQGSDAPSLISVPGLRLVR